MKNTIVPGIIIAVIFVVYSINTIEAGKEAYSHTARLHGQYKDYVNYVMRDGKLSVFEYRMLLKWIENDQHTAAKQQLQKVVNE
jgi:uncharacterized protein YfaP (DUF2135 family)